MSDARLEVLGASMPFAKLVGLNFIDADKARVRATVTVGADHCTAGRIAHGGFLMTLADCAGAIGAFLNLPEGAKGTTTTESKTNLIAAAPVGSVLMVTAEPVSIGRRLQVWQTRIETAEGKLVALTTQSQMNL
ncbi:PaaI family thioesterase [Hyphomonas sp.]|jgi:1,4-dihydroxy-2-naphthoyl-CoA hydrolase|uniref:PaaI family thioesterase n=1 Tax=Hyphomonas sp. TaxID=87 RepID=UPI0025C645C1|nr:PaaI family thioesterase [Hyphomonas sp.]